jgi:hypothetical protein
MNHPVQVLVTDGTVAEVGVVGLVLNAAFAFLLWRWLQSAHSRAPS